ncbi:MAG: transglycosylase SLT domain-containing protein [Nitrospirae bacterium]|nr:transglycosylase SLT domain-containing protein [Nitrospirota bacterium]
MYHLFTRKSVFALSFILLCFFPCAGNASEIRSDGAKESQLHQFAGEPENRIENAVHLINTHSYKKAAVLLLDIVRDNLPEKDKAVFLLGRLYKEEGSPAKAESFFITAADAYPLLSDYSLSSLVDIYMSAGKYEKTLEAARRIKNILLLQYAKQSEINALLELKRTAEAREALAQYVEAYPPDWDYKLTLAVLLKNDNETDQAVRVLKEIYINAVPLSNSALKELVLLKADTFTKDEILKRADKLFEKNNFQRAETEYQKALTMCADFESAKIMLSIGMCQFRMKRYTDSSRTFGLINTPEALYWQAQAFYRMDDRAGFEKIKNLFEKNYPDDDRLGLLLIMEGEDFRRQEKFSDAGKSFKQVLEKFPSKAEDALWGLGWMNYTSGDYSSAYNYFSKLAVNEKSSDYYKYLYWKARSHEKATEACLKHKVSLQATGSKEPCDGEGRDFFDGLPADRSFYGYLIKMRSSKYVAPEMVEVSKPSRPAGELYERIDALASLGMREEAVNEIVDSLKRDKNKNDFMYLGYVAMELGEYRKVIALAEKETDREFLPFSYPFGFGDTIEEAAGPRNVDKYLVAAVIREESRFDPKVVSWAGAVGLMQLMPATAYKLKKDIKLRLKDRSEIHDVKKNILMGTHYLSQLIRQFKEIPLALAAYNAGENALKRWMAKYGRDDLIEFIENIPYKETRFYVKKVLKSYWRYRTINGLPIEDSQIVAQRKL